MDQAENGSAAHSVEISQVALEKLQVQVQQHIGKCVLNLRKWIEANSPEQTPERYGRVSWKQVLHEAGQFHI